MFIPTYALSEDDKALLRKLVAELLEHGEAISIGTDGDGLEMRLSFRSQHPIVKFVEHISEGDRE
ncbi:hypothetical protein [Bacillus haynesii]|uniref:hypothetical protein n=1 Tax=Bacillus haynesii TaxID=1925021 RepID=UPI002282A534|nr:hypothetical protein [Bacillus haynesii]MCY8570383.1 hypothetical protein [Bacillus haynesii]